jgi:arabinofuranosyltransferase
MQWIERLMLVGVVVLAIIFLWKYSAIQQDDAYIFYTYARNLVARGQLVFTPEVYVNGSTSLLYPLVLAALHGVIPVAIPKLAHILGAGCLLVLGLAAAEIFIRSKKRVIALTFPMLLMANPLLALGVGMETLLMLALAMLAIEAYAARRYSWTAVWLLLATLARPDVLLLAGLIGVDFIIRQRRLPPVRWVLIWSLGLATALGVHRLYFDAWLPMSIGAKLGQAETQYWGEGWLFLQALPHFLLASPLGWGYFVATGVALLYLLSRREYIKQPVVLLLLAWGISYVLVYGLVLNPPAYPWYYAPLAIVLALIPAVALEGIAQEKWVRNKVVYQKIIVVVVLVISVAGLIKGVPQESADKYRVYSAIGQWLMQQASPGDLVGANEVGVLGYVYTKGAIIDALGLVTPEVAERVRRGETDWYITEYEPEYLVLQEPPRHILEEFAGEEWFKERYSKVATFTRRYRAAVYARRE